ncbi:MAG: hypothetical protein WD398_05550 [Cyclobacteriaceae bacterium]
MELIKFDREELEEIFERAGKTLFSESKILWLKYDKAFLCQNSLDILNLVKNSAIVYCIWISDGSHPIPIYVGHSSSKLARQRITNHFIKKDPRTGSQLEKIITAVIDGNKVGLTFLKIEPDYMRKPMEEWLISKHREKLDWNIHGRNNLI